MAQVDIQQSRRLDKRSASGKPHHLAGCASLIQPTEQVLMNAMGRACTGFTLGVLCVLYG